MAKLLRILLLAFLVSSPSRADRVMLPPFCNNSYELITPGDARKIQIEDASVREVFIMQALGQQGLAIVQKAVGIPPFQKVQTLEEALAIVDAMSDDPGVYQPVNKILNDLSPARSWALYLNTGFHAVSTYTDGHRSMIQQAIGEFPKDGLLGGPPRVIDVGIGNGNLVIAAAIQNPHGIVHGIDIAGAGLNISTYRLNEVTDLAAAKYQDPALSEVGRFWMGRGSATDPQMFQGPRFDAGSMVLTLFAIPPAQRKTALKNMYDSLRPGARFVMIDPVPKLNNSSDGKDFLREIVKNAYQNNTDLTALDLAILTAKNAHNLLKTEFLEPEQQRALAESVGFSMVGTQQSVYYGIATMTVFEKPF